MGRQMVDKIQVMFDFGQVSKFLGQANEFKSILKSEDRLDYRSFFRHQSIG